MKRKKFVKQLQAMGIQRNAAAWYVKKCQEHNLEYASMIEEIGRTFIGKYGASKIERDRNGMLHVRITRRMPA